ncbi:MAG: PAS domain-containing protein [Planctomycetota bacterium]|jgi:PAS domain S-box-containing protein
MAAEVPVPIWIALSVATVVALAVVVATILLVRTIRARDRRIVELDAWLTHFQGMVETLPGVALAEVSAGHSRGSYLSPRLAEILGLDAESIDGPMDFWRARLHPEDRQRVLGERRACLEQGRAFVADYRLLGRHGSVHWFHEHTRPVGATTDPDEPDAASRSACGLLLDITHRKECELALEEQGLALTQVLETAPIAICLKDEAGRYTFASRWWTDFVGLSGPEEARGRTDDELGVPGRGADDVTPATIMPLPLERQRRADGEMRWLAVSDAERMTSAIDLTSWVQRVEQLDDERRQLEEQKLELERQRDRLRLEEQRLQTLMEGLPQLIFFKDAGGRYVRASASLARLAGRDAPAELAGRTDAELFDDATATQLAALAASDDDRPLADRLVRLATRDGGHRWFAVNATTHYDGDGNGDVGSVGIATDVTDLQETLLSTRRRAQLTRLQRRELEIRHRRTLQILDETLETTPGAPPRWGQLLEWMKSVHGVLQDARPEPRPLTQIVQAVAPVFPLITFHGEGTDILIPANQVTPFATVIYHLLITSLDGGALSEEEGRVRILWDAAPDETGQRRLRFQWCETPSAMVEPKPMPEDASALIDEVLSCVLGGNVQFAGNELSAEHHIQLLLEDGTSR